MDHETELCPNDVKPGSGHLQRHTYLVFLAFKHGDPRQCSVCLWTAPSTWDACHKNKLSIVISINHPSDLHRRLGKGTAATVTPKYRCSGAILKAKLRGRVHDLDRLDSRLPRADCQVPTNPFPTLGCYRFLRLPLTIHPQTQTAVIKQLGSRMQDTAGLLQVVSNQQQKCSYQTVGRAVWLPVL
jgi:hypothetical protein